MQISSLGGEGGGVGWGGVKTQIVCALPDKRHPSRSSPGEVDDGEDAQCVSLNPLETSWGVGVG